MLTQGLNPNTDIIDQETTLIYSKLESESRSPFSFNEDEDKIKNFIKIIAEHFLKEHDQLRISTQPEEFKALLIEAAQNARYINEQETEKAIHETIMQLEKLIQAQDRHQHNTYLRHSKHFNHHDQKPLCRHPEKNTLELTNDYIRRFMPQVDNSSLLIVAELDVTGFANLIHDKDVINTVNNEQVKSIVIPIGPGHWRLAHIEKPSNDAPNQKSKLTIFDSLGKESAVNFIKRNANSIRPALKTLNVDLSRIEVEAPAHVQENSFSCGDFIIAKTHAIAKKMGLRHNREFVDALNTGGVNTGANLRALMIAESEKQMGITARASFSTKSTTAKVASPVTNDENTNTNSNTNKRDEEVMNNSSLAVINALTQNEKVKQILIDFINEKQQAEPASREEETALDKIKEHCDTNPIYAEQVQDDAILARKWQLEEINFEKNRYSQLQLDEKFARDIASEKSGSIKKFSS